MEDAERAILSKQVEKQTEARRDWVFKSSCVLSMALTVITFCVMVSLCPVSGWTLGAMTAVTFIGIGGVLHMYSGGGHDGQKREG